MESDLPPPPAGYEPQPAAPPALAPAPPAAEGALQEMASATLTLALTLALPYPTPTPTPTPNPYQEMASAPMAAPEPAQELPVAAAAGSRPERPSTARRAPPKVRSNEVKVERPAENAAAGVILDGEGEDDDTIVMVDNQGDGVDMSSMAHDKTGEGHGKLVRNLIDTLPPP